MKGLGKIGFFLAWERFWFNSWQNWFSTAVSLELYPLTRGNVEMRFSPYKPFAYIRILSLVFVCTLIFLDARVDPGVMVFYLNFRKILEIWCFVFIFFLKCLYWFFIEENKNIFSVTRVLPGNHKANSANSSFLNVHNVNTYSEYCVFMWVKIKMLKL